MRDKEIQVQSSQMAMLQSQHIPHLWIDGGARWWGSCLLDGEVTDELEEIRKAQGSDTFAYTLEFDRYANRDKGLARDLVTPAKERARWGYDLFIYWSPYADITEIIEWINMMCKHSQWFAGATDKIKLVQDEWRYVSLAELIGGNGELIEQGTDAAKKCFGGFRAARFGWALDEMKTTPHGEEFYEQIYNPNAAGDCR